MCINTVCASAVSKCSVQVQINTCPGTYFTPGFHYLFILLRACFEVSVVVVPTVTVVQFTFGNMNRNCSFIR